MILHKQGVVKKYLAYVFERKYKYFKICFSRNHENFTSLLLDETITYSYRAGQEEVQINGMTIEEYLSANTTKHEFIRKHTHTATRNFNKRVKTFISTIVMNSFSPLHAREYSYRVEFQMRGNKSILIK